MASAPRNEFIDLSGIKASKSGNPYNALIEASHNRAVISTPSIFMLLAYMLFREVFKSVMRLIVILVLLSKKTSFLPWIFQVFQ